jgi:hypothetical protein
MGASDFDVAFQLFFFFFYIFAGVAGAFLI